jgi:putative sterol carrier protein
MMADALMAGFFTRLDGSGHEPLLRHVTGTLRFDVVDDGAVEHWLVTIRDGSPTVTRSDAHATAVIRATAATTTGLVTGELNLLSAVLRGDVTAEGDLGLVMLFQRLFPSPSRAGDGARATTSTAT